MSTPAPPPDPTQPYEPSDPYGRQPPGGGAVPGPPYAAPSGPPTTPFPAYQPPHPMPPGTAPGPPGTAPGPPGTAPGPPGTAPGPPGTAPGPPAPRRSNVPLIAVIVAVTLLLCGGTAVAGVLAVQTLAHRAKEAAEPLTRVPAVPTDLPIMPTELPTMPTDLSGIPGLPTDENGNPYLPDGSTTVTVRYEVTGDGPADITYIDKLGGAPKRVEHAALPWRMELSMSGMALVSVVAVRTDTSDGSIACTATVDDEQVAKNQSEGSYAVATCSKLILK
jgi:hypothetical protein